MRAETHQPGTHVDDRPSTTRRLSVTARGARVGEAIASRVLFAPPRRGACAGGLPQLLRDVGAMAGGQPRYLQGVGRFRQLLDRRAAGAGWACRGCLSVPAAPVGAIGTARGSGMGLPGILLSAVLPAAKRRLRLARLFSGAVPMVGDDLRRLCRRTARAGAKKSARRRADLG